jgi:hypothetical protein
MIGDTDIDALVQLVGRLPSVDQRDGVGGRIVRDIVRIGNRYKRD